MAQPHQVNASITARCDGARSDYGVDVSGNLHDRRAYNCVNGEKPALRRVRCERLKLWCRGLDPKS